MNTWIEDEIKKLPADELAEALHDAALRAAEAGFIALYNAVNAGTTAADLDKMIPWRVEKHLDKAERFNPSPCFSTGLRIARKVVSQIKESAEVRKNPELIKWGLLYAAEACSGTTSNPAYAIVDRRAAALETKGIDLDRYFAL